MARVVYLFRLNHQALILILGWWFTRRGIHQHMRVCL